MKYTLLNIILVELNSLGVECNCTTYKGVIDCIRKYKLRESIPRLKYTHSTSDFVHSEVTTDKVRYSEILEAFSGNFGSLYTVLRNTRTEHTNVFLKIAKRKEASSLHMEAVLQAISNITLSYYGFPWAVPRVLDIVRHPHFGICFSMEKSPDATLFKNYLEQHLEWEVPSETNDYLLLGVISQLATYLAILEHELLLNHRDLTGNNVVMIVPTEPTQKSVSIGNCTWMLQITHKTIIIDFGFSCIGTSVSKKIAVSAGDYLSDTDFCPKDGRDLFLFIASLWQNTLIRNSLTMKTRFLIHKWLSTGQTNNWAEWIEASMKIDIRGMYLLTMSESFSNPNTNPLHILKDISHVFPLFVYFQETQRSSTPIPRGMYE